MELKLKHMQINILSFGEVLFEKYSLRLDEKIETLIFDFNNDFNTNYESFLEICAYLSSLNIKFVKGRGHRKSKEQKYLEKSMGIFRKISTIFRPFH